MSSYSGFFSAAASVAGALTGLLFVALSVSPERLRRTAGTLEHQAVAATAFTALLDALFVSLGGLVPGNSGTRYSGLVLGLIGLTSTAALTRRLWLARGTEQLSRRWPYVLVAIIAMYAAQCIASLTARTAAESDSTSVAFIMALFAVGIARSWELLGLRGGGLLDLLSQRLDRAAQPAPGSQHGAAHERGGLDEQ